MALNSYVALQDAVLTWLARPGDPLVAPNVPDMIRLFEAEATRRLKVGAAEKLIVLTTVAGVPSVPLPADFGEARRVSYGGRTLAYVPPTSLPPFGGLPLAYTLWGQTQLWLGPAADNAYEIELLYQSGVPPLAETSTGTNFLLENAPDAYLFGTLVEAELFIGHDERVQIWAQRREAAFASIELADRKARGGSPMQIRVDGITTPAGGGASGGGSSAMASVSVGDLPPAMARSGDLWWDSSSVGGGQLYVRYIDASGDARWTAATNQPGPSAAPGGEILSFTPISGETVTLPAGTTAAYILSPALAALTVRLPPAPISGDTVELSFAAPVAALQIQNAAGTAVPGGPVTGFGPGAAVIFRYLPPDWIFWK